jgi:enoyl-CoA hydratase/carnithine racemase
MTVTVERHEHITVISLNRPEVRNAINPDLSRDLRAAFEEFTTDREARVAVLRGEGKDFCAGVDLRAGAASGQRGPRAGGVVAGGILREFECTKPIVAALHGNVVGGGLEIALCADLRVADTTMRFGSLEARWGLMPGGGATQRLTRALPMAFAMEIMLTADRFPADRALAMGLVNSVVPEGQATEEALRLARTIASRAPLAIRRTKEAAVRGREMSLAEGLRLEELLARTLAGTTDLEEGTAAFLEHREARFQGR